MKLNTGIIAVWSLLTMLGSRPLIQAEWVDIGEYYIDDASLIHSWPSGAYFEISSLKDKKTGELARGACYMPPDNLKHSFTGMSIFWKRKNMEKKAQLYSDSDIKAAYIFPPRHDGPGGVLMGTEMDFVLDWCFQQVYKAGGRHPCLADYYIKVEKADGTDKLLTLPYFVTLKEASEMEENGERNHKTSVSHDNE